MHRHVWTVKEKETHPSAYEQATARQDLQEVGGATLEYFERPVIVTYRCSVCPAEKVERV